MACRHGSLVSLLICAALGAGCNDKGGAATKVEPSAPPPGTAATPAAKPEKVLPRERAVRLVGERGTPKDAAWTVGNARGFGGHRTLRLDPELNLTLDFVGPAGAALEVAGQKATFSTEGKATVKVNLVQPLFAALKTFKHTGKSYNTIEPEISLPVSYPGGKGPVQSQIALRGSRVLAWYLDQTVAKGKPARAPEEPEARAKKKAYLTFYPDLDKRHLHFDPAETSFYDIDLVVISEYLGSKDKSCGVYRGAKTGRTQEVHISLVSRRVTVVDRRTGKVTGQQTFVGRGPCPRTVEKSYKIYYPDDKAMERFIRQRLR